MAVVIESYRAGLTIMEADSWGRPLIEFWINGRQLNHPDHGFSIENWSVTAAIAVRTGWIPRVPYIPNFRVLLVEGEHPEWVAWDAANPPENDPPLVLDPNAQLL